MGKGLESFVKPSVDSALSGGVRDFSIKLAGLPAEERQYWVARAWAWAKKKPLRMKFILSYPAAYGQQLIESLAWCFRKVYQDKVDWHNEAEEIQAAWDL